jgi:hypothetical protein
LDELEIHNKFSDAKSVAENDFSKKKNLMRIPEKEAWRDILSPFYAPNVHIQDLSQNIHAPSFEQQSCQHFY